MRPVIIVELEVLGQPCLQFNDTAIILDIHILIFDRSPQALHKDVIQGSPPPIMAYGDAFCLWSLLKILGLPSSRASSRASRQEFPSGVLDNRQDSTDLLYQSMMATRYIIPGAWGCR
jgi:hypothetical protein